MAAEFDVSELKKIEQWIGGVKKNTDYVFKRKEKKFADAIGVYVFQDVMDHFKTQSGGQGQPWAKWSEAYADHMRRIGRGGNKILQWSGRLRNTFEKSNYRKKPDGLEWYNQAKTKSGFPYAAAHDDGGGNLPQRSFMWLSNKAMDKIIATTMEFMLAEDKNRGKI